MSTAIAETYACMRIRGRLWVQPRATEERGGSAAPACVHWGQGVSIDPPSLCIFTCLYWCPSQEIRLNTAHMHVLCMLMHTVATPRSPYQG